MTTVLDRPARSAMFGELERQAPDPLLAVIGMHRSDPRPDRIDVGVGVYRDAGGATPVMGAVKAAEARLLAGQDTKGYLGAEGDQRYTDLLARVALGPELASDGRITGIQTPGGTGALRLAAELVGRTGRSPTVWVGAPTWPNHGPILREAGLVVREHHHFHRGRSELDFETFVGSLTGARAGDVILLHGCCHNPTGTSFSPGQWRVMSDMVEARGLVPLIDLAYQGLGRGLEEDAAGTRDMLARVPEAMIAYSCDKNFALYRERVGALWVQAATPVAAVTVRETMLVLARSMWSMPPDHGAAVVRLILEESALESAWRSELVGMCARINALRSLLGGSHPALAPIAQQQGLFALLPIDGAAVVDLRERHAIYMPESGRINVAGLNEATISRFVAALAPHLPH